MRVLVVTPPEPVVSLAEAKDHLRVRHDEEDALIEAMVAAATASIDGPDGWLGRAIGVQTLDAFYDGFCDLRALPYPPTIDIMEVRAVGADGASAPVASSGYVLRGSTITPAYGGDWPVTRAESEAVRIRYRAGYETLPPALRAAILLMTNDLYRNRSTVVSGLTVTSVPMSLTVDRLLSPFRVYA